MNIHISERSLRDWFSKELITEAETRGFVFQGEDTTGSLPNQAVARLERQFIIRSETRAAGKWYELVHDRFVDPILQANNEWNMKNPRPALADTEAWLASGRDRSRLYDGRQLKAALEKLENRPETLADLDREFIRASQVAASQQRARTQRWLIAVFILIAIILAGLALFSYQQSRSARKNESEAVVQKITAQVASTKAMEAQQNAVRLQQTAVFAATKAAIESDAKATAQAKAALGDRDKLAIKLAQAANPSSPPPDDETRQKNLLLSLAAYLLYPSPSTLPALFQNLTTNDQMAATAASAALLEDKTIYLPAEDVRKLSFSGYGSYWLYLSKSGNVRIWDTDLKKALNIPDSITEEQGVQQIYSSNPFVTSQGNAIITISDSGKFKIWVLKDINKFYYKFSREIPLPKDMKPFSLAVKTSPDQIAIGLEDGRVMVWDSAAQSWQQKDQQVGPIWSLSWYGSILAIGGNDGSVKTLNISDNTVTTMPEVHRSPVRAMSWITVQTKTVPSSSQAVLITGSEEGRLARWNTQTHEITQAAIDPVAELISSSLIASTSSYTHYFIAVSSSKPGVPVKLYNRESLEEECAIAGSEDVQNIAFLSGSNTLLTRSPYGQINTWLIIGKSPLTQPLSMISSGTIAATITDGSGNTVLLLDITDPTTAALNFRTLRMFSAAGAPLGVPLTFKYSIMNFGYVGKQPTLAIIREKGLIELFDALTGKPVRYIQVANLDIKAMALSPDGAFLAAATCTMVGPIRSGDLPCVWSEIALIDPRTGLTIDTPKWMSGISGRYVQKIWFRPDGEVVAVQTNKEMLIGKLHPGSSESTDKPVIVNPYSPASSIAFNQDSNLIALSYYNSVELWDLKAITKIGVLRVPAYSNIVGMTFFKDNLGKEKLLLYQRNTVPIVVDMRLDFWIKTACELAGRDLTSAERIEYLPFGSTDLKVCP